MSEVLTPNTSLAYTWRGREGSWLLGNGSADFLLVRTGDGLPDGQIADRDCILTRGTIDPATGQQVWYGYYALYLNPFQDWDFRGLEKMRIQLRTNHPEIAFRLQFHTSPWAVFNFPLSLQNQWTEHEIDLRTSPDGMPNFVTTAGFTLNPNYTGSVRIPADYYVLASIVSLEPATATPPKVQIVITPSTAQLIKFQSLTLTANLTYGSGNFLVEWFNRNTNEKVGEGLTYTFTANEIGIVTFGAYATDLTTMESAVSNIATLTVVEFQAISILHTSTIRGKGIFRNAENQPVVLRGLHDHGFLDTPLGTWIRPDGSIIWSGNFDRTVVSAELDAIKATGANVFRIFAAMDFWINNTSGHRQAVKDFVQLALERGIYVMFTFWARYPNPAAHNLPWTEGLSETDFVTLWGSVATELRTYPNVLFEIYNEPNGSDAEKDRYFNIVQSVISTIRAITPQPIIVSWNYMVWVNLSDGHGLFLSEWINDERLTGQNVAYVVHQYENSAHFGDGTVYARTYDDLKRYYQLTGILDAINSGKVLFLGEIGRPLTENESLTNALKIANEELIGFIGFWYWTSERYALLTGSPNYQLTANGATFAAAFQTPLDLTETPPTPPPKSGQARINGAYYLGYAETLPKHAVRLLWRLRQRLIRKEVHKKLHPLI